MTHSLDTVLIATSLLPEGREAHGMAIPAWFGEAPLDSMGESGEILKGSYTALRQEIADETREAGIRDAELVGSSLKAGQQTRRSADWTFVADEQPQPTREESRETTETAT